MPVEAMPTGEFPIVKQTVIDDGASQAAEEEPVHSDPAMLGDKRLLFLLLGTLIGAGIASTSLSVTENQADRNAWLVFLLIAGVLGAAAGEAFGFGLARWFEVKQYHVIKRWRVWLSLLIILTAASGLVYSTPYVFDDTKSLTTRGILLSALAIVGGLPTAATLSAIKQAAADPLPGEPGQQLAALLRMRQMSARLLNQLGVLVLLIMAVNAAAANWGSVKQNPNVVIFSGVVAAFIVAIMYVPTASALRRRGSIFVERHFPLVGLETGDLVAAAEDRQKLERMLSLDQTTFGELKAGLVVLTPLAIGLVAAFLKGLQAA